MGCYSMEKTARDPRLSPVILTLVEMMASGSATAGEIAEAVLRAADEASMRCNICGGIVSYHDVAARPLTTP
jgi:hypothetical protein